MEDAQDKTGVSSGVWASDGRAGPSRAAPEELAKEFEPSAQSIRHWVKQAQLDEGKRTDGLTTHEQEELVRLRRENRRLREEREILSKAEAWFAREADSKAASSS